VNCVSPGWIDVRDAQMDRIESFPGTVPEIWYVVLSSAGVLVHGIECFHRTEQHKEMWVGREFLSLRNLLRCSL